MLKYGKPFLYINKHKRVKWYFYLSLLHRILILRTPIFLIYACYNSIDYLRQVQHTMFEFRWQPDWSAPYGMEPFKKAFRREGDIVTFEMLKDASPEIYKALKW